MKKHTFNVWCSMHVFIVCFITYVYCMVYVWLTYVALFLCTGPSTTGKPRYIMTDS